MLSHLKSKYIYILLVLIAAIASYMFVRGDLGNKDDQNQENLKNPSSLEINQIDQENTPAKEFVSNELQDKENATEAFQPLPSQSLSYNLFCGSSMIDFDKKLIKLSRRKDFSPLQDKAIKRARERCAQWYNYFDSFSDEQRNDYLTKMQDARDLNMYFFNIDPSQHESYLETARSVVAIGGDQSGFSERALKYLLNKDKDFLKTIAKELNILDTKFITKNIENITVAYSCTNNYDAECSANSFVMTGFCIEHENMCGISMLDYFSARTTANNFADAQLIVDIINRLVREGYFDQYEGALINVNNNRKVKCEEGVSAT